MRQAGSLDSALSGIELFYYRSRAAPAFGLAWRGRGALALQQGVRETSSEQEGLRAPLSPPANLNCHIIQGHNQMQVHSDV